jgi:hypothetical protein
MRRAKQWYERVARHAEAVLQRDLRCLLHLVRGQPPSQISLLWYANILLTQSKWGMTAIFGDGLHPKGAKLKRKKTQICGKLVNICPLFFL